MSEVAQQHALRIVESHGFNAHPITDGIAVEIPWTADGGQQGVYVEECHSHREVFAALGY